MPHRHFWVNPYLAADFAPANAKTEVLTPLVTILKNMVKKRVKLLVTLCRVIVLIWVSLNHLTNALSA